MVQVKVNGKIKPAAFLQQVFFSGEECGILRKKRKYGVKMHKKPVYTCLFFYLTKAKKRYIITLLSSAGDRGREWGVYYFNFVKRKKKRKSKRSPFREEDRDELKKLFKKGLTKERKSDIIIKLPRKRAELITKKLFEKNLKKVLDKKKRKWYNIKAVSQERATQKKLLKKLEKSTWQTVLNVI